MTLTSGADRSTHDTPEPATPPTGPSTGAAADADGDVALPVDGLELIGPMEGSGYRNPPSLVRRGDGQTIQLTTLLYLVLDSVDGHRTNAEIAERVSEAYGRTVGPQDVATLVDGKLRTLGLVRRADGSAPEVKKSNPLLSLRWRFVIANPKVTRAITAPFAILFLPVIIPVVVAVFALVTAWALFDKGLASGVHQAFDRPELLLAVFAISVFSAGFHEFGHAAAARYGGATPGAMGAGLYLIWPAFYTDVTDSYRLGRGGRLRTDLGGLYFNMITCIAMFGIWWATGWDAFLLVIPAQLIQMIQQLTPMVRFDGYHVLADLTGVPDLYHRIKPTLLGLLPNRWRDPEAKVLKPWARAVVTIWVLLVVPLIVAMLGLMILSMPRLLATAWSSLTEQWSELAADFDGGDVLGGLAGVLAVVAIVVPVLGVTMILSRLVRKATRTAWRATEGRTGRRVGAEVTALVLVAGLAIVRWPGVGNYQPVQAWERGTVGDVVAEAADAANIAAPRSRVREGRGGVVETIWPAGPRADVAGADQAALPTRDNPVLALVLVPTDGAGEPAPAWVFPFNRPLPPEEGDNQALAVNTEDGSTLYEVAFALVWVTDGDVVNTNEAYAFASCQDCTTVAVGFQVVLALGRTSVAIPQNLAGAVNFNCLRCVTQALATQLVVTLPNGLSAGAMSELAVLWEEIGRFGVSIRDVPLSELRSRLTAFERQILDIIERDGGLTTSATATTVAATVAPAASAPADEPTSTDAATPAPTTTAAPARTTVAPARTTVPAQQPTPTTDDSSSAPTPTSLPEDAPTTTG